MFPSIPQGATTLTLALRQVRWADRRAHRSHWSAGHTRRTRPPLHPLWSLGVARRCPRAYHPYL